MPVWKPCSWLFRPFRSSYHWVILFRKHYLAVVRRCTWNQTTVQATVKTEWIYAEQIREIQQLLQSVKNFEGNATVAGDRSVDWGTVENDYWRYLQQKTQSQSWSGSYERVKWASYLYWSDFQVFSVQEIADVILFGFGTEWIHIGAVQHIPIRLDTILHDSTISAIINFNYSSFGVLKSQQKIFLVTKN